MGLLWDMFRKGISLDEAQVCLGELGKIWNVFCECLDEEVEFRGIYLRKIKDYKSITLGLRPSELWELCIAYSRDDYDCYYKAVYDTGKSNYDVKEGYDLSLEKQKSLKGYLFNSIKSICILNNKISDVIIKSKNVPNTLSVVSLTSGRTAIIYEGDFESMSVTRSLVRKNIESLEESFYSNIISL